jgi:hypothetical protein
VTVGTVIRGWFVEKNRLAINHFRYFVTVVTNNFGMASRQREVRTGVMIKGRGNPSLDVVTIRASGLASLGELGSVGLHVAAFTDLRCSFELGLVGTGRGFVACATGDSAVCSQKREFGFRMVKAVHVCP